MSPTPSSRGARPSRSGPSMASAGRISPAERSIEVRDGHLRLVVVADTHGRPHPESSACIAAEAPDYIVHAGDIGELTALDQLERIAPVLAVRGNIDAPVSSIPEALTLSLVPPDGSPLKVLVVHIAVFGPKIRGDVAALARSEGASLVICGHSHVPFIGRDKGLAVFNPGSIGPRRFQLPIVFGVLDLDHRGIRMRHVDCETGQAWSP